MDDPDQSLFQPGGSSAPSSALQPRSLQRIERLFRESFVGTASEIQRLQYHLDQATRKLSKAKQRKGALATAKHQLVAANQRLTESNKIKPVVVVDLLQGIERVVTEADMDSGSYTRQSGDLDMSWCVKFAPLAENTIRGPFTKSIHHLVIRLFDGSIEAHPFQDASQDELQAIPVGFRVGKYGTGSAFVEIPCQNRQTPMIKSLIFVLHSPTQEDYTEMVAQTGEGAGSFLRLSDYVDLNFSIGLAGLCFHTNRIRPFLDMWGILPPPETETVAENNDLDDDDEDDDDEEDDYNDSDSDTEPLQIQII